MNSRINCTCGWSWNKSDSSKKDMYICHECGRDNKMKNGGWLDKYSENTSKAQQGTVIQKDLTNLQASQVNNITGVNFEPEFAQKYFMTEEESRLKDAQKQQQIANATLQHTNKITDITSESLGAFSNKRIWHDKRPEYYTNSGQEVREGYEYTTITAKNWPEYQKSPQYKKYKNLPPTNTVASMQQGGITGSASWDKQLQRVKQETANKPHPTLSVADLIAEKKLRDQNIERQQPPQAQQESTRVNTNNKPERTSKVARNKTDKEIAESRKYIREKSDNALLNQWENLPYMLNPITAPVMLSRENLSEASKGLESKFRVSDEPNFFDDYVNPMNTIIGSGASNLGQAPLIAQQEDSYLPYLTSIGAPLAVGAMAGFGSNSTGQFVNNLANPLAGFGLKDRTVDALRIGKDIMQNPKVFLKEAAKEIKKLPNQTEQIYHTFMDRNKPLYKIGSDNLENALESKIKNLQTEEGFYRLVNQELEITKRLNPYHKEKDLLEKANKNANARIDELSQTENLNKSYLDAKLENPNINPFVDFEIPRNNAHFQGTYNNLNLNEDFLKKINKDFILDEGMVKPGKIAIGREYAEDIGVFAHEINHALQNGRQTKIDKDIIEHFNSPENRKVGLTPKKRSSNKDEAALSYLLTGSKGKEPSSFLAEARQTMLNKNLIKGIYEPITPDIIEKSMQYFSKNPIKNKYTKTSSTRIFDIANKNSAEFLANQMNKLPAIAPIAGASYLATQNQKEYKDGGIVKDNQGYWNPDNWGKDVEIDQSNPDSFIDMNNVYEPLLGVSKETGETRVMYPGEKHKFGKGTKNVIESSLAKNGLKTKTNNWLNKYES